MPETKHPACPGANAYVPVLFLSPKASFLLNFVWGTCSHSRDRRGDAKLRKQRRRVHRRLGGHPRASKWVRFAKAGKPSGFAKRCRVVQTFTRTLSIPKRPQLAEAIVRAWPVRSPATCDSQPTSTPAKLSGFFSCTHSRPAAVWSYPRKLVTA